MGMEKMRKVARSIALVVLGFLLMFRQVHGEETLEVHVDESTIIRFFYLPVDSYLHPALAFRVAPENDARFGTAPIDYVGRTPYVSLSEMRNLVSAIGDLSLSWQTSPKPEVPKLIDPRKMPDKMEIEIFSSRGTDRALVDPTRLCETLAPLDEALNQRRARWEFELFRVDYGCKVPGFDRSAFPEHDDPKAATKR
jgi:hypothetical protein